MEGLNHHVKQLSQLKTAVTILTLSGLGLVFGCNNNSKQTNKHNTYTTDTSKTNEETVEELSTEFEKKTQKFLQLADSAMQKITQGGGEVPPFDLTLIEQAGFGKFSSAKKFYEFLHQEASKNGCFLSLEYQYDGWPTTVFVLKGITREGEKSINSSIAEFFDIPPAKYQHITYDKVSIYFLPAEQKQPGKLYLGGVVNKIHDTIYLVTQKDADISILFHEEGHVAYMNKFDEYFTKNVTEIDLRLEPQNTGSDAKTIKLEIEFADYDFSEFAALSSEFLALPTESDGKTLIYNTLFSEKFKHYGGQQGLAFIWALNIGITMGHGNYINEEIQKTGSLPSTQFIWNIIRTATIQQMKDGLTTTWKNMKQTNTPNPERIKNQKRKAR